MSLNHRDGSRDSKQKLECLVVLGCVAALLVTGTVTLAGSRKESTPLAGARAQAQAIFNRANSVCGLERIGGKPFRLEAHITEVDPQGRILAGFLTVSWKAWDAWRRECVVGGDERVEVRNGNMEYRLDHGTWTVQDGAIYDDLNIPLRLYTWLTLPDDARITISRHKLSDGIDVSDVLVQNTKVYELTGYRFNLETGTPLSEEDSWGFIHGFSYDIREGRLVPVRVQGFQGDKQISLWVLTAFSGWMPADDAALGIPKGALAMPVCEGSKDSLVLINHVNPVFPLEAQVKGLSGRVLIRMRIAPDGSVIDPFIVRSTDPLFTASALKAVKQWKYRLSPCEAARAPLDWLVAINYVAPT